MKSISNTLRLFAIAIVFMVSTAATISAQENPSSDKAYIYCSVTFNDFKVRRRNRFIIIPRNTQNACIRCLSTAVSMMMTLHTYLASSMMRKDDHESSDPIWQDLIGWDVWDGKCFHTLHHIGLI